MKKVARKEKSPLYYVGTIPIFVTNPVMVNLRHDHYAPLVRQAVQSGVAMAQLIKLRMGPCQHCGHDKVVIDLVAPPARIQKGPHLADFHKNPHHDGQDHHNDPQA